MTHGRLAYLLHFEPDFLRELLDGDYPACDPYHSLKRKAMLASNDMRLRLHERMYLRKLSHWAADKAAALPSLLVLNGYVSEAASV
ncbi:hypothetical protein CO615_09740 [Lysobacteraceae bacterium NML75-0749]|nr:hypothetical protein CO615_09740 [Xanthomonadaceae bacterium NML75-0749]